MPHKATCQHVVHVHIAVYTYVTCTSSLFSIRWANGKGWINIVKVAFPCAINSNL